MLQKCPSGLRMSTLNVYFFNPIGLSSLIDKLLKLIQLSGVSKKQAKINLKRWVLILLVNMDKSKIRLKLPNLFYEKQSYNLVIFPYITLHNKVVLVAIS